MSVLKRPLITEKISALNEEGKYGFIVDNNATKVEIKKAIKAQYGVDVESVNTINVMGKRKTRYTKKGFVTGRKPSFKKAIVKTVNGEPIDFYDDL